MKAPRILSSPAVIGILIGLLGTILSWWLANSDARRFQDESRDSVLDQLGTVRAAVERSLNERIYLTMGLRAFVSTHPNLDSSEFAQYARALMAEGHDIRSVTLIKDNVISDVYPREGNESALGIKLLDIPEQRADVLRAIETRQSWLSAPIKLVQGGEAFVNRAPVYVTPPDGLPGSGSYWGMVSILIDKNQLLDDIVEGLPETLRLAMRVRLPAEHSTFYFFGDESIESTGPLTLDVNLPTGDWQVVGVPARGWPERSPASVVIAIFGSLASLLLAILTYMLLRSNEQLRTARQAAEGTAEQLAMKNEDLEAFVRSASHDLRAPLRHISSYSQVLKEDASDRLNEDDLGHLNRLQGASQSMMQLLDSLLKFAKAGSDGLTKTRIDLNQTVRDIVNRLSQNDVEKIHVGNLPVIDGDRHLLTQVLQNLIENGLKYNRSATASVSIEATKSAGEVTIRVTDNGIGLSSSELERVFKPGVRGLSSTEFSGTGFGLAICDRIVKAHRGKFWGESKTEKGSTFYVSLPQESP
ncbi:MAG: ATP-binding protein [Pirellulaceae bacterium]